MKATALLVAGLLVPCVAAERPDALSLLKSVCQHYADAKSYHIEAVQEQTTSNELHRNWNKELLVAVVAPNGKYRYEGRSGHGSAILVSDGETRWAYHLNEHLYTRTGTATKDPRSRVMPMEEIATQHAKSLVKSIALLGTRVKSATLMPDEKVVVNGRKTKCRVIHLGEKDFRTRKPDFTEEETLWIDESRNVIVKIQRREHSYLILFPSRGHIPIVIEETILYPVVQLGGEEPASSFTFSPPQDAHLVESFPDNMMQAPQQHAKELLSKEAPDIHLKEADGKLTSLSELRGKPVFIEFWATWCAPCLDLMADLKSLYAETSKSVVWLSIDSDEDADAAKTYLSQEHISWPNYHDEDGSLGKAFQRDAIPLGVLIDADGKITFYKSGYDISELRAALAKLSPGVSPNSATPESK